jgi:hypothetical protein
MRRRTFLRSAAAAALAAHIPHPALLAAMRDSGIPPGYRPSPRRGGRLPDVEAVTGDGREVVLKGADLAELASGLRGRLLLAGDEGYEDARHILNPSFDRRPAVIAQVTGVADIRMAVGFARDNGGVLLAVKCGGHSFSGASTCDRGMMIDLSPFRDVRVDPQARRAWVTGGSLLGAVDHETMAHGLAVPLGTVSHTGAGGLVTGGGFGRLARRWGLSIDNLESVQVVTADGRFLRAGPGENEDLFWGVRGGGGNFGIVTSFEFRLHPMQRQVIGGSLEFPGELAREALELYAEYGEEAPDELQLDFSLVTPPGGGERVASFEVCWSGPAGEAERALAPIRRLGTPLRDGVGPVDYVALQRSGDTTDPRAMGIYLKSGFLPRISPELVSLVVDEVEGHPERVTVIAFQQAGGAIARVSPSATAFPQRDALFNMLGITGWAHGAVEPAPHMGYMRDFWRGVEPHTHGFYSNDMALEATNLDVQENFRENHARLVAVKNRYDAGNLFRLNANVLPTV